VRHRKEKDSLGVLKVPADALYGIFTQRAYDNFRVSGVKIHPEFIRSLAMVKKACAVTHMQLDHIDKQIGRSIVAAADEVISGKHIEHFVLDVYQAGAGTAYNMNMNEVLANRAIEIRGGRRGDYKIVHPNNHVNMGQSTNNVIPTTIRITTLHILQELLKQIEGLEKSILQKAKVYKKTMKLGRTHLEDAVPVMWGQVFNSYYTALKKNRTHLVRAQMDMLEVGLGGTAIGTGLNTTPLFQHKVIDKLGTISKLKLRPPKDNLEITWNMNDFLHISSALRLFAVELNKICNDLRLLNSGPNAGLGEIVLPEVEPGSSIMPGKINPSILEAVNMICYQVIGYDHTIEQAVEAGQLELNVMTPLIAHNLFMQIKLLSNGVHILRYKAINGLTVRKNVTESHVDNSLILITALNPYIGYDVGAAIVGLAIKKKRTIIQVIDHFDIVPKRYRKSLLDPKKMTHPHKINQKIVSAVKKHKGYKDFKKKLSK